MYLNISRTTINLLPTQRNTTKEKDEMKKYNNKEKNSQDHDKHKGTLGHRWSDTLHWLHAYSTNILEKTYVVSDAIFRRADAAVVVVMLGANGCVGGRENESN